jgi:hypothetical protein
MTTVVILNAVLAVLIIAALVAVKIAAYNVAGREHHEEFVPASSEDERLAA